MQNYPAFKKRPFVYWKPLTGTLTNSEDPVEMLHYAAFHQGLHCLLRYKQSTGTEIHHNWEMPTCDPLKYIMDNPILIGCICMGKSTILFRVLKYGSVVGSILLSLCTSLLEVK